MSLLIPFYAIICFLSIAFPEAFVYLDPWLEFVQSISLEAYFLLMCQFVSPSDTQRDVFFATLVIEDKKSPTGQKDGLVWFRVGACPSEAPRVEKNESTDSNFV